MATVYEVGYGLGAVAATATGTFELPFLGAVKLSSTAQASAFYYPTSVVQAGGFTSSNGQAVHSVLDEPTTPDAADYAQSATDPTGGDANSLILGFTINAPAQDASFVWKYQIWGAGGVAMTVQVMEGNAVRASWLHDPAPTEPTTFTRVLSPAEIASITDPTAQTLRVIAG